MKPYDELEYIWINFLFIRVMKRLKSCWIPAVVAFSLPKLYPVFPQCLPDQIQDSRFKITVVRLRERGRERERLTLNLPTRLPIRSLDVPCWKWIKVMTRTHKEEHVEPRMVVQERLTLWCLWRMGQAIEATSPFQLWSPILKAEETHKS